MKKRMTKKDIQEIKRRYTKDKHNFTRIAGCYVDNEKNKIISFSESPEQMAEDDFFKYLAIAGKCLSGRLNDNILQLPFPDTEILNGERYDLLQRLRKSELKDQEILEEFFDIVIENYTIAGNFLMLLFRDVYDIPMKTKDQLDTDESEYVYDYILGAICPVNLSKAALGYREDTNEIGALRREWTVSPVESGFMFPSFSERNADFNTVTVYQKNPKAPHREFFENCLHATSRLTSSEKKTAFEQMVNKSLPEDDKDIHCSIADNLSEFIDRKTAEQAQDTPVVISGDDVKEILTSSGVEEIKADRIKERFEGFFNDTFNEPEADELLDKRLLKDKELRDEKAALAREVHTLQQQLNEAGADQEADITVRVPSERAAEVTTAFIDEKRCLVIPLDPADTARVNGEEKAL